MTGHDRSNSAPGRRGFTLLEVAVVVMITAILAVAAMPAMGMLGDARRSAAAECVERTLSSARARALASGVPVGLRIDPATGAMACVEILNPGEAPTPVTSALGEAETALVISTAYAGVRMTEVVGPDGGTGATTVWFGIDGTPQRRDSTGALLGNATGDCVVRIEGDHTVRVRAGTGAITR